MQYTPAVLLDSQDRQCSMTSTATLCLAFLCQGASGPRVDSARTPDRYKLVFGTYSLESGCTCAKPLISSRSPLLKCEDVKYKDLALALLHFLIDGMSLDVSPIVDIARCRWRVSI